MINSASPGEEPQPHLAAVSKMCVCNPVCMLSQKPITTGETITYGSESEKQGFAVADGTKQNKIPRTPEEAKIFHSFWQ